MFHSCTLLAALILLVFSPAAFAQDHGDLATYTDVGAAEGALPIELCAPILDSDTCIQWSAANTLGLYTGGNLQFSIDGNGKALFQNSTDGTAGFQVFDMDGGTSVLTIDTTNERVGLGIDDPAEQLHIVSTARITAGNAIFKIEDTEAVGNAFWQVGDATNSVGGFVPDFRMQGSGLSGQGGIIVGIINSSFDAQQSKLAAMQFNARESDGTVLEAANLFVWTHFDTHIMTIDVAGHLGINDTTPDAMLDLVSNGSAVVPLRIEHAATPSVDYMQVVDSGGTALWVTDSTGDIDITDGQRLRYDGAIVIQGDATDNNWFFGEAGNLTMTGGTNFGIGVGALDSVTTGSGNVAIGVNSLTACATCVGNTAIGNTSLFRLNAAAPFANSNTAIGTSALQDATTSRGSIAIGALALLRATTGEFNVGIGNAAGTNNLTGTLNVFIGNSSGVGAVGTSHSRNSCFGAEACSGLAASGNNNIGIGYQGGDNITTGDNNLILGYQVDAQSATASNQMSIGNLLFSEGIDGTGTTLSSGFLGIATPTPAGILSLGNATEGGTWAFNKITTREVHTLAAANTSDTTTITIPSGASLRGCSFNVDTAVTTSSATNTWSAAFITGSTAALATAVAGALNTKANQLIVPEIASAATEIRFTAPGAETFTAGVIEALCIYESLTSMADA